jgi:UDP-N-acetylmuramyl pentapeptide phosphotransferase/UDP-N-acetylglucosamine-1-phosphate transferase
VDIPNERSSHAFATVRGAGLALALTWSTLAVVIIALQPDRSTGWFGLVGLAAGLSLIGFWDDLRHLSPLVRLGAQLLLALAAVAVGVRTRSLDVGVTAIALGPLAVPICTLGILTMVNLFNFMDGIDGLAIGQTLIAALVLMGGALIVHATTTALLAAALAGVAGGFLPFNWSPAKCFMGDAGSYFCGAALAGLLIMGQNEGVPLILVGLSSAIFLGDGIVTLTRRLLAGQAIWQPHRTHLYQRLVAAGWSHARVSTVYMTMAAILGATALLFLARLHNNAILTLRV